MGKQFLIIDTMAILSPTAIPHLDGSGLECVFVLPPHHKIEVMKVNRQPTAPHDGMVC